MTSMGFPVAMLALALAVACGKGSGTSPAKPKAVADAVKLVELGQCEAAASKLREHTSSHPDSFDGFLVLGDALVCSCYDPAAKTPGGMRDPAKCKEALSVYESALKLKKDSVAALVSAGVLALMLDDKTTAAGHLEAAAKQDPGNSTAANFLALASRQGDDEAVAFAALERHYAGRKPSDVAPPSFESLCGTDFHCGTVVLLEAVTQKVETHLDAEGEGMMRRVPDDKAPAATQERRYEAGAVIEAAELNGAEITFTDRLHPIVGVGGGWVVKKMPGWRNPDVTRGPVVERRIPELPPVPIFYNDNPAYVPKDEWDARERIRALRKQWEYCEENRGLEYCGNTRRGKAGLEAALGLVADVLPGSINVAGSELQIGPSPRQGAFAGGAIDYMFVLVPVKYTMNHYVQGQLPVQSIAIVRSADPARIAVLKFLSLAEKRAVLAGQLWKGAPLYLAVRAREYELRSASLSLREGRVSLRFPWDGQVEVYEDGECEIPVNSTPMGVADGPEE